MGTISQFIALLKATYGDPLPQPVQDGIDNISAAVVQAVADNANGCPDAVAADLEPLVDQVHHVPMSKKANVK